jgi:glycosyltransferase involved in cell wall biosynthesis
LVGDFQPDVVVVEGLPLFPLLRHLRPVSRLLILDMHNVESHLSSQMGKRSKQPALLSRFFPDDAARILRLERKAIPMVDRVWVCSDQDQQRLHQLFPVPIPVDVVPNGIPRFEAPKELPPFRGAEAKSPTILFVGHLSYRPNIDAAVRLATKILPLVQQRFPEPRLILAGRSPAPAVQSLENVSGVEILANPDDILSLMRQAHLTAVPLLSGGGTRLKILEAMAWGLPIVATSRAVEGLGLVDGRDVLIAEADDDFAKQIVTLCAEPKRVEAQRQAAHEKVITHFGRAAIERAVCKGLGLDADQA